MRQSDRDGTRDAIAALTAALAAEREARQQAEARASGAEALVAYYKLQIAKLRRDQYGIAWPMVTRSTGDL